MQQPVRGASDHPPGERGGAGVRVESGSPLLLNCIIEGNSSSYYSGGGGGLRLSYTTARVEHCQIRDNSISGSEADGGGINIYDSAAEIVNCLITGNTLAATSNAHGGGIYFTGINNIPEVINCTISGHAITGDGGGIYSDATVDMIIRNSIIWGNTAGNAIYNNVYATNYDMSYSDIGEVWPGTGNISADPLFVNPPFDDYHLQAASPAIDKGYWQDEYGNEPEPNGDRVNLGFYGHWEVWAAHRSR